MANVQLSLKLPPTFSDAFVVTWEILNEKLQNVASGSFFEETHDSAQLAPGTYWARIQLPGGQMRSKKFAVPSVDASVRVDFDLPIPSRNEWLGWATISEAADLARDPVASPVMDDLWVRSWEFEAGHWVETDDAAQGQLFKDKGLYQLEVKSPNGRLLALQVGGASIASRIVILPAAGISRAMITTVEDDVQIVVSLRNSVADHLARLLTTSTAATWQGLDKVFMREQGRELLLHKRQDPVGATVGGYFLVQDREYIPVDWLANLANWNPWLADGAIQYAFALVSTGGSKEVKKARDYLERAAQRGYPVFFRGIELFLDTIRLILSAKEYQDTRLEELARPYAAVRASTTRQGAFTSFFGKHPAMPMSSDPNFGSKESGDAVVSAARDSRSLQAQKGVRVLSMK